MGTTKAIKRVPRKSTTVRAMIIQTIRFGISILQRLSAKWTADIVFRLMFRARRHKRPEWEVELLSKADDHFLLPWRDGHLAAWSWGQGPTVLLVHGWEGRGTQLGKFVEPLLDAGYRVVAFDGPAHGDSTVTRASIPDQTYAIERVAQHVGAIDAIIAHSMGGAATTFAAARGLNAQKYILISAPTDPNDFFRGAAKMLGFNQKVVTRVKQITEKELGVTMESLHTPTQAAKLDAPALIIHDEGDRDVIMQKSLELHESWVSSELMITKGLGHRRILKDSEVLKKTTTFLRSA